MKWNEDEWRVFLLVFIHVFSLCQLLSNCLRSIDYHVQKVIFFKRYNGHSLARYSTIFLVAVSQQGGQWGMFGTHLGTFLVSPLQWAWCACFLLVQSFSASCATILQDYLKSGVDICCTNTLKANALAQKEYLGMKRISRRSLEDQTRHFQRTNSQCLACEMLK